MKKIPLLLFTVFIVTGTEAQLLRTNTVSNSFADSLNKIVIDFRRNFSGIQGKPLPGQADATAYLSTVCLPGARHCFILRYRSQKDNSSSWQSILYEGENYEEALKIYKSSYKQLISARLTGIEKDIISLKGVMEKPDENVRFAVTSLRLNTTDAKFKNFAVDLELTNSYDGWEVHLNLYTKSQEIELPDQ